MESNLLKALKSDGISLAIKGVPSGTKVIRSYEAAKERYLSLGIDTDIAIAETDRVRIGHPCWAIDSVGGYEVSDPSVNPAQLSAGGIQPPERKEGGPRNLDEHLGDLLAALRLVPGPNAVLVHNLYADTEGKFVDRNEREPKHFQKWVEWAKENEYHLHMNPSPFRHKMAQTGFTLSSPDSAIRYFWVEELKATRRIAQYMGESQGAPCVLNVWIPDGALDARVQRHGPRVQLWASLDEGLKEKHPLVIDAVEGKLFGLGSENYVVGSHQFYSDYSLSRGTLLCIDTGHFNNLTDLAYLADVIDQALVPQERRGILTHISYPDKWDSDFVARTTDWLRAITDSVRRSGRSQDVWYGNDYFQPGAHPIAMIAIGGRTTRKALLWSNLDPYNVLASAENADCDMAKLAISEERTTLPFGAVWDMYCLSHNVPIGISYLNEVAAYERNVMAKRD